MDAPANSGEAVTSLWLVFSVQCGEPIFLSLFHSPANAEEAAAQIEGARIERVVVRDKASREVLTPLIA